MPVELKSLYANACFTHSPVEGAIPERTALTAVTVHLHGNTKDVGHPRLHRLGRSTGRASPVGMETRGGGHGADLAATPATEAGTLRKTSTIAAAATTGTTAIESVTATDHTTTDEANIRVDHILDTAIADTGDEA